MRPLKLTLSAFGPYACLLYTSALVAHGVGVGPDVEPQGVGSKLVGGGELALRPACPQRQ